jgi:hypothetical protein
MNYTLKDVLKKYIQTQPKMDWITKILAWFGMDIIGKSIYGSKLKIGKKLGIVNIWDAEHKNKEHMENLFENEIDKFCEDYELLSSRNDYGDFDVWYSKPTSIKEEIYYTYPTNTPFELEQAKEAYEALTNINKGFIDVIKKEK